MSSPTINYNGATMVAFDQIRVGRFRLYSAALPECLELIKELWKTSQLGTLGKQYTIRPMPDQVIGEEAVDNSGKVVAVFGYAVTNSFVPSTDLQKKYLQKLTEIVQQT